MSEVNENTPVGVTEAPAETPVAKKTQKRKPPKQTRSLEELFHASLRSLDDSEKIRLINGLKEALDNVATRCENLEQNCQSAYEKANHFETKCNNLMLRAQTQINFAKQAVATCNTSLQLLRNLED